MKCNPRRTRRRRKRRPSGDRLAHAVRELNLGRECVKAALTGFFVLLLSTCLLLVVYRHSPGEYSGEKLDRYLLRLVASAVDVPRGEETLVIKERLCREEGDAGQIVLCGNYRARKEDSWGGRFVFVFERAERGFWNCLVGTRPRYRVVYSSAFFGEREIETTLQCMDSGYEDIDGDGSDEIMIEYRSYFADRISNACLVLQQVEGRWQAVCPDLSAVDAEVRETYGANGCALIDSFDFVDPRAEETEPTVVYGLSHGGVIRRVENPIWGGYDWLYCITVHDGLTGLLLSDQCAYIMMRVTDHGVFPEPNWNGGKPLFAPLADDAAREQIGELWGYRSGDVVFYGQDVE